MLPRSLSEIPLLSHVCTTDQHGPSLWPSVRVVVGGTYPTGKSGVSATARGQIALFRSNMILAMTSSLDEGMPVQMDVAYIDDDVPFLAVLCKPTWAALKGGADAEVGAILVIALSEYSCAFREEVTGCANGETATVFLGQLQVTKRFTNVQAMNIGDFMSTGRDQVLLVQQNPESNTRHKDGSEQVLWALTDLCWKFDGKVKLKSKKKKDTAGKTKRKEKKRAGNDRPISAEQGQDTRALQLERVVKSLRQRAAFGLTKLSHSSTRRLDKVDTIHHLQHLISRISLGAPASSTNGTRHPFLHPRESLKPYGVPTESPPLEAAKSVAIGEPAVLSARRSPDLFSRIKVLHIRHRYCCASSSLQIHLTFENLDSSQATALRWVSIGCSKNACSLCGESTQVDVVAPGEQCTLQAQVVLPAPWGRIGSLGVSSNNIATIVDISLHYQVVLQTDNSQKAVGAAGAQRQTDAFDSAALPGAHVEVSCSPFEPRKYLASSSNQHDFHYFWAVEVVGQISLRTEDFLHAPAVAGGKTVHFFPASTNLVLYSTRTDLRHLSTILTHTDPSSSLKGELFVKRHVIELGDSIEIILDEAGGMHHRTCTVRGRDLQYLTCFLENLQQALPDDVTATIDPVSIGQLRLLQNGFEALKDEIRSAVEWRSSSCGKDIEHHSSSATSFEILREQHASMIRYCDMIFMKQMETDRLVAELAINTNYAHNDLFSTVNEGITHGDV
jgi:hypothetical protein